MALERDQNIIDLCLTCKDKCGQWLDENRNGADDTSSNCMNLMKECYDICSYTVISLQRETPFAKEICHLCELICEACGNECSSQTEHQAKGCAEICYEVAESCRQRLF